jgi:hypothetical protein
MGTYRVVQITEDGRDVWAIEWAAPGHPTLIFASRFDSPEAAQIAADRLASMEGPEPR